MSIPWVILFIVAGCAYLAIGYGAAMFFTMDGPPERWLRVLWRFALLFFWLPIAVLTPIAAAIAGLFD